MSGRAASCTEILQLPHIPGGPKIPAKNSRLSLFIFLALGLFDSNRSVNTITHDGHILSLLHEFDTVIQRSLLGSSSNEAEGMEA